MNVLIWVLLATFLVSLLSWVGAATLFLKEKLLDKILLGLVAFAAGALIGGAFLHLLPEAILEAGISKSFTIFLYLLAGYCTFFILEQFIHWHHCHSTSHTLKKPVSYLILISDGVHNFIDGLVIAGSFIAGIEVGIVTTIAVALHEIPQEIGDFGVLIYGGFEKVRALVLNFISAIPAIIGGLFGLYLAGIIGESVVFLLPFAAGNFIYIASADLVPEMKKCETLIKSILHFFAFLLGLFLMIAVKFLH